jgi:Protein of unknown function (DUF3034)
MELFRTAIQFCAFVVALSIAAVACAQDAPPAAAPAPADPAPADSAPSFLPAMGSGKLLLTQGISNVEGAAGGGLASWAVITGYETRDQIGGNAHFTYVGARSYSLTDFGASVGLFDRLELSYTRQQFDTGQTGARLGLGAGFTFDQDVFAAKLKLFGDAVYDQDSVLPQVAIGVQYKRNDKAAIVHAIGGRSADGVDYYVAATKVLLNQSLVLDATLRLTKANQTGLLGFGGDRNDNYQPQFEGSIGYLVTRRLVIGGEYRTKPSNLGFARENDWYDLFAAYALSKHLSATVAYVDLGSIATIKDQTGVFLSLQAGF